MKEKKIIDIWIIRILIALVCIALLTSLTLQPFLTLKVLSILGGLCYFIFIISHLALCFPTVMICMVIYGIADDILDELKERSDIIFSTLVIIFCAIGLFVVYFLVPIGLAMMYIGSIDLNQAMELLHKINKP